MQLMAASMMTQYTHCAQVLKEAAEVDKLAKSGKNTGPLCGLSIAVKDNIDVAGYPTEAGTPSLEGRTAAFLGRFVSL